MTNFSMSVKVSKTNVIDWIAFSSFYFRIQQSVLQHDNLICVFNRRNRRNLSKFKTKRNDRDLTALTYFRFISELNAAWFQYETSELGFQLIEPSTFSFCQDQIYNNSFDLVLSFVIIVRTWWLTIVIILNFIQLYLLLWTTTMDIWYSQL